MGKTTNILDLNNRLTKVEKENVAQNSYTSLKNKPKINSVTLTGNKSLADIGAAAAADLITLSEHLEDLTALHDIGADYDFADLTAEQKVTWFTNWTDNVNFPVQYGSGVLIPSEDPSQKTIVYVAIGAAGSGEVYTNVYKNGAWGGWVFASKTFTYMTISSPIDIKDFFKKLITQVDADLSGKPSYTIFNIFSLYPEYSTFYGIVERQDAHAYAFSLSKASGDHIYQGYCNLATDSLTLYEFTGTLVS